ncbi:iron-sulfur cluster assembly scaffold protein [Candidatus Gracilibacteria bacterium]|nr:iron-sulfur cluster assembly scaffold protein [Candidatus Gracilibacteria bacterium]
MIIRSNTTITLITSYMSSQSLIIEYSSNPPNKGVLKNANIRYREANRVCADVVEVSLIIRDNILTEFMFDGYMSIVATACVSITGELLEGSPVADILKLDESFVHENIGVDISPRRRYASLIGLLAVKNGIHEFLQDGKKEDFSDIVIG